MRLIGIGLMAFLLAGIALFLSNSETLRLSARALSEVALGPRLNFEASAFPETARKGIAVSHRAGPSVPLILSGLPAYQSATFYMPIDARPTSGYLQIDATTQVLAGVKGVLRISIGNTRRAELLLRPGEAGRSLRVQLTEPELAREKLVVSFSLQGQGPHAHCAIDEGVEAIVEIETTSAIFLELGGALKSPRDLMLTKGRRVAVEWSDLHQTPALLAGRKLLLSGIQPRFGEAGITPKESTNVADAFIAAIERPQYAWSAAVSANASIFGMRRFYGTHTWRIRYDMRDGQDASLPDHIELNMMLGQLSGGATWQLAVALNGKHVYNGFEQSGAVALDLPLKAQDHRRQNTIEITVASTQDAPGTCNRGPEVIAEISDTTMLRPGQDFFENPLLAVTRSLDNGWHLTSEKVSPAEAAIAARLLARLPEPDQSDAPSAKLRVLPRGTDLASWPDDREHLLILQFDEAEAMIAVPLSNISTRFTLQVSILVDLTKPGS